MHHEPLAFLDQADDLVARDGAAAARELHRHAFGAADGDGGFRFFLGLGSLQQPPGNHGGQTLADTMAGNIQLVFGNTQDSLPHLKSGRLRALATTSAARSKSFPDLPTISESGVPGYDLTTWHGWLAPARTPAAIVTRLSEELARVVKSPEVASKVAQDGVEPIGSTPEQFRQVIATEVVRTLVGSIGLVASVPLTTALAVVVVTRSRDGDAATTR